MPEMQEAEGIAVRTARAEVHTAQYFHKAEPLQRFHVAHQSQDSVLYTFIPVLI